MTYPIKILGSRNRDDESKDASIFGAELKNGKRLCVNYLRQRDLYEKRIILHNLNSQKWFKIYKIMPEPFVFQTQTKGLVVVGVAFG